MIEREVSSPTAPASPRVGSAVGRPVRRREDRRLLTGRARFGDDGPHPGALVARFVRSPHAHARIVSIDAAAALALPGVVAVFTCRDFAGVTSPLRMAPPIDGLKPLVSETMPTAEVRFDGDLVGCVVAEDAYVAADAVDLVAVEYEQLQPSIDVDAALAGRAELVDQELGTNLVCTRHFRAGDPDRAFARSHRVVEATFRQHRMTHAPVETRGCVATWDEGREQLTMETGTQAPHPYRTSLAARLRLREHQVRVISPDVGGAFGQKIAVYREDVCVAALARALGRPVRWQEDRSENLKAALHSREDRVTVRAAVGPRWAHPGSARRPRHRRRRVQLLSGQLHARGGGDDAARAL